MNALNPRQIGKVVYEAIRAYEGTMGAPDKKHWESAESAAEREDILVKVDAALRGQPQAPGSIRPSDAVKRQLIVNIVAAFVSVYNPPVVYATPPAPVIPAPDIPVEVFPEPTPEELAAARGSNTLPMTAPPAPTSGVTGTAYYADGTTATGVLPLPEGSPTTGAPEISKEAFMARTPGNTSEALAQADVNIADSDAARTQESVK